MSRREFAVGYGEKPSTAGEFNDATGIQAGNWRQPPTSETIQFFVPASTQIASTRQFYQEFRTDLKIYGPLLRPSSPRCSTDQGMSQ
jgi:hypothetical protein